MYFTVFFVTLRIVLRYPEFDTDFYSVMTFINFFVRWSEMSLMLRILVGLFIGALLGLIVPQWHGIGILGTVFVSALKAVAPILVAVLIVASVAKAGHGLGSRFSVVVSRYILSTFIAAMCAVVGSFLFPVTMQLSGVTDQASPGTLTDVFVNLLSNMVTNPIVSISNGNYIGILFWSILMGIALKITASRPTIDMVQDFSDVFTYIVNWIIQFAPLGIMGLVYSSVSETGLEVFTTYGHLLLLLVGCMLANTFIFNPLISYLMLRRNPYPLLFTCLKESGLQAFFTRSSAANIPVNMKLCQKLGLDEEFYSVSIPLGSAINMDGAAVTITVMTLAVAHTVGVDVSFASALFLSIIATLAACGASGIAGGSLLLVPMACSLFNIGNDVAMQAVAVGFIIGVVQDSVETALNSSGDVFFTATAEYYDRMKKEKRNK